MAFSLTAFLSKFISLPTSEETVTPQLDSPYIEKPGEIITRDYSISDENAANTYIALTFHCDTILRDKIPCDKSVFEQNGADLKRFSAKKKLIFDLPEFSEAGSFAEPNSSELSPRSIHVMNELHHDALRMRECLIRCFENDPENLPFAVDAETPSLWPDSLWWEEKGPLYTLNMQDGIFLEWVTDGTFQLVDEDSSEGFAVREKLSKHQELRSITLFSNSLFYFYFQAKHLPKLRVLILSDNEFLNFPQEIFGITSLEYLDLSRNSSRFWSVPDEIANLKNLRYLDLSGNQVGSVSDEIAELTNLAVLKLKESNLSAESKKRVQTLLPNCRIQF